MHEDRVITTEELEAINWCETAGWLQLGPGLLKSLHPYGTHVLVPLRPLPHGPAEDDMVLVCEAQLHLVGESRPTPVPMMVPLSTWESLPTAFDALARATELIPQLAEEIQRCSLAGDDEEVS